MVIETDELNSSMLQMASAERLHCCCRVREYMKIYALLGSYICFRCFHLVDLVIQIILNVNISLG